MWKIFQVWSNLQEIVKTHATGEDFRKSISVTRNIRRGKEIGKRKNKQGESGTMCCALRDEFRFYDVQGKEISTKEVVLSENIRSQKVKMKILK